MRPRRPGDPEDGAAARRPVDPRSRRPAQPMRQPGYYPGYSTLGQQAFWDRRTREVILARVERVPPIRFFTPEEAALLVAVCDHVLPQDDRDEAHRIPIVPFIDARLFENRLDGYRYAGMPPDQEAYRLGLRGIEAIARHFHGRSFLALGPLGQDRVLKIVHDGVPPAGHEIWERLPVHRFWLLLVQDCAEVYYAHPWAWDEIGFGGPAYPRAYMRLEGGQPEPWEVAEQRYEWEAPPTAVSDAYEPVAGTHEHKAPPGQGGTH